MPPKSEVNLTYGAYYSWGIVDHRTYRLEGLIGALKEDGHTVTIVEKELRNRVQLIVNGECVFTCDIRDLDYGGDGKYDELVSDARVKVHIAF